MEPKIESLIQKVNSSLSSIYSKEDVIKILETLDKDLSVENDVLKDFLSTQLEKLSIKLKSDFRSAVADTDFDDFCDLELNGKKLEVNFDDGSLIELVENTIDESIEDYDSYDIVRC
jgi:hypothetical protein